MIKSGRMITYTPGKTATWEESIRAQALKHKPDTPFDCPLRLKLIFQLPRPKSRSKKELYPDRRPDLDNYIKSLKDALNGIIWTDDARIVEINARKEYGELIGVWVEIEVINMPSL